MPLLPFEAPDIVLLQRSHDRASFDCGEPSLNSYLQRYARQNAESGFGLTYVAVPPSEPTRILGYYTLSASRIERNLLPSSLKLPPYPVPALLLARLAIDKQAQGFGLGARLMEEVLERACALSGEVGVWAIEVEALNDKAAAFYARYGFLSLQDSPHHLFLPLQVKQS